MLTRWPTWIILIGAYTSVQLSLPRQVKVKRLYTDTTRFGEVLRHQESIYYLLSNLKPNWNYELRVSYPATTPTDFIISLEEGEYDHTSRKLLNIDKLVFENKPAKLEKIAKVTALRTGVPREKERLSDPVLYNIVLETLYFGLPVEVWKMGAILVTIVIFAVKYAIPWTLAFLDGKCARIKIAQE